MSRILPLHACAEPHIDEAAGWIWNEWKETSRNTLEQTRLQLVGDADCPSTLMAVEDGCAVGVLGFRRVGSKLFINSLFVRESARGQGIGGRLLTEALARVGSEELYVYTSLAAWYEVRGFAVVEKGSPNAVLKAAARRSPAGGTGHSVVSVDSVDVHLEGGGDEAIVMVHGWPDTYRLWDAQVAFLKERYRCVRFTLPGFDLDRERRAYSIDEVAEFMRRVVEQVSPGRKVILLLHDWGCGFGYQFYARYPELVSRVIGVDIGDTRGLKKALSTRGKLIFMAYQWWLALSWVVGGKLGDGMSRWIARWWRIPSDHRFVSSCMTYPYYRTWFGGRDNYGPQWRRFAPACPMLFIYGRRKPIMFHTESWLDELRRRKENRVVEFDTGHWIMLQQPERFNQTIGDWLAAKAP